MSHVKLKAAVAGVATGTSAKTVLQLVAAANHRVVVKEVVVTFAGQTNGHLPILAELLRQSDAGTMSSLTPKKNGDFGETLQTTAQHTATVEPTPGDVLDYKYIHPQGGHDWQAVFGDEYEVPGGGRLAVRVTAANDVNCAVSISAEE